MQHQQMKQTAPPHSRSFPEYLWKEYKNNLFASVPLLRQMKTYSFIYIKELFFTFLI